MKKREIIKSSEEFNKIIKEGKKITNDFYLLFSLNNFENKWTRFGLAIGKKNGNAVKRNKIKRRLRALIDNNNFLFKKTADYIIMVKKGFLEEKYAKVNEKLKELLEKEQK